jgi:cytochrome c-type biogenesis protein CcmH/NrfG
MPVILQIEIANSQDYRLPELPEIGGCEVESAGVPSQSSRISIINGRRSESRSVTMQYRVTPRRTGTFTVPPLEIEVDGRMRRTQPLEFVAVNSETGDLLFVEIEGSQDQVYVGQPLDLTLKIWLKPFRDRQSGIVLSEGQMWQMISQQTSWGSFGEPLQELASNNRRPAGREVLREDADGTPRTYYLYEIDATVYPTRPGEIDASDVQVVVQYPTALGRSRDPFDGFFEDSPLGGSSLLRQMMEDDFFASPFGSRLSVKAARPIVGEARVDSTEVLPVPDAGRPDDYRGAVGRYRIVTEAEPTTVQAGDPVTLRIGIVGDGPMELVQAPPLAGIEELTADFRVTDQSLAGFVRDDTKVFVTTIRPRREGIAQIPPIPFSFFDPQSGKFETVYSDPIPVNVTAADTLSLDAIVSPSGRTLDRGSDASADEPAAPAAPDFENNNSLAVLSVQEPASAFPRWWWYAILLPPLLWLGLAMTRGTIAAVARLPGLRSARSACLRDIQRAGNPTGVMQALVHYIHRRGGQSCRSTAEAVGVLRTSGLGSVANQVESFFNRHQQDRLATNPVTADSLNEVKDEAGQLIDEVESAFRRMGRNRIRRSGRHERASRSRHQKVAGLLALLMTFASGTVTAETAEPDLSRARQEAILQDASRSYTQARQLRESDAASARQLFSEAAAKYQFLVDAGINSSQLFVNLGNARWQSGELGRAIASYHRALQIDPADRQARTNLTLAEREVAAVSSGNDSATASAVRTNPREAALAGCRWIARRISSVTGLLPLQTVVAISSLLFWSLLIARTLGYRLRFWRWSVVPLLVTVVGGVLLFAVAESTRPPDAVLVADAVELREGDGQTFDVVHRLEAAEGQAVRILSQRGGWWQVETAAGQTGWLPADVIELIAGPREQAVDGLVTLRAGSQAHLRPSQREGDGGP